MAYEHVLVKQEGDVTTITLNRPEKRNALSLDVMRELTAAFAAAGESDALGVILAANGPVFSAGHNFADMAGADLAAARRLFEVCTEMMDTIQAIPQPVVAKVHALATAAGCQLVATCDLAVAAEEAGFAIPGGKGGLFCHTPLVAVARNVGRKRALELAMTGDVIDAATAADWGLVNKVVPAERARRAPPSTSSPGPRGAAPCRRGWASTRFYAQIDLDQPKAYAYAVELMAAAALTGRRPRGHRRLPGEAQAELHSADVDFELPGADDPRRLAVRSWLADHPSTRRRRAPVRGLRRAPLAAPWGLGADPMQQLLIDEELAAGRRGPARQPDRHRLGRPHHPGRRHAEPSSSGGCRPC